MERSRLMNYIRTSARGITAAVVITAASSVLGAPPETHAQNPPPERPTASPTPALRFNTPDSIHPNQQINHERFIPIFVPDPVTAPPEDQVSEWTNTARITFYCLKENPTFLGTPVRDGVISVDPSFIPFWSLVDIEGHGRNYSAEDKGSGVKGWHIDMWKASCDEALELGSQTRRIRVKRLALLTTPDNL